MPRPNPGRTLGVEDLVADRVAQYREQSGYGYESLAVRMREHGCAIHASALYKIEKGEPRRRITVDELVALAAVFDVSLDDLTKPLPTGGVAIAMSLGKAMLDLKRDTDEATAEAAAAKERMRKIGLSWTNSIADFSRALGELPVQQRGEVVMALGLDEGWLRKGRGRSK